MKTILRAVTPAPVLCDPNGSGRWCWGVVEPITDMCGGGNATLSWWNDNNTVESIDTLVAHCCPDIPKGAKISCVYDGAHWTLIIVLAEKQARSMPKPEKRK